MGTAQASQISPSSMESGAVLWPAEWRYRRFILHYAHFVLLRAGWMRFALDLRWWRLTQIRGAGRQLSGGGSIATTGGRGACDFGAQGQADLCGGLVGVFWLSALMRICISILIRFGQIRISILSASTITCRFRIGAMVKITRMRIGGQSIILSYLKANIAGGEGYDWYYDSAEGERAQRRKPIEDGAYGEPWVLSLQGSAKVGGHAGIMTALTGAQLSGDQLGAAIKTDPVYRVWLCGD